MWPSRAPILLGMVLLSTAVCFVAFHTNNQLSCNCNALQQLSKFAQKSWLLVTSVITTLEEWMEGMKLIQMCKCGVG